MKNERDTETMKNYRIGKEEYSKGTGHTSAIHKSQTPNFRLDIGDGKILLIYVQKKYTKGIKQMPYSTKRHG